MATKKSAAAKPDPWRKRWEYSREWHDLYATDPAAAMQALNDHPLQKASDRLSEHLSRAHLDPVVNASEQHSRLIMFFHEIVDAAHPGMTAEEMLLPVHEILRRSLGKRDGKAGGGRPTGGPYDDVWLEEFEKLKRRNPALTKKAACEHIAAKEARAGTPTPWTTVREGVNRALKKLEGKPPFP